MKFATVIYTLFLLLILLPLLGCDSPLQSSNSGRSLGKLSAYAGYTPTKTDIMPLTEFVIDKNTDSYSTIRAYVCLLDSSGSQVKSPAVFRFELYEYVERSARTKGKRLAIWPDIDLTAPVENNRYWRDFLRAYQFNLPFEPQNGRTYILEVTCSSVGGRRLSNNFNIKFTE